MRFIYWILLLLFSHFSFGNKSEVARIWTVTTASTLKIDGTTNVNNFQCASSYYTGTDIIREIWNPNDASWEIQGKLYIDVQEFDCQNRIMNNDFRNTLQAEKHPEIQIEFVNLQEKSVGDNTKKAIGITEITLAGQTKRYNLSCELIFVSEHYSILRGTQVFRFSDFGLEPPQKGFGLVRVNDEIQVSFELILVRAALTDI